MNVETAKFDEASERLCRNLRATAKQVREPRKTCRAQARKHCDCHCGSGKRWLKCCWPATCPEKSPESDLNHE